MYFMYNLEKPTLFIFSKIKTEKTIDINIVCCASGITQHSDGY